MRDCVCDFAFLFWFVVVVVVVAIYVCVFVLQAGIGSNTPLLPVELHRVGQIHPADQERKKNVDSLR